MENAYADSQLPFPYTFTHVSSAGKTIVDVQSRAPPGTEGGDTAGTYPSKPDLQNRQMLSRKISKVFSKMLNDNHVFAA